jgi:hypothetical protein
MHFIREPEMRLMQVKIQSAFPLTSEEKRLL